MTTNPRRVSAAPARRGRKGLGNPRHRRPKLKARREVAKPSSPPRGQANDGNFARLLSGNILYDPGLELYVGNAVGSYKIEDWEARTGLRHYTIPIFDTSCPITAQRWPNGDCVDYYDIAQWVAMAGTGTTTYAVNGTVDSAAWNVQRYTPYLGDYHLIWHNWTTGPLGNPVPIMVQSPGLPGGYSARVDSGDLVTFSIRTSMWGVNNAIVPNTNWSNAGDPRISTVLYFYNQSGGLIVGSGNYYEVPENWPDFSYHEHQVTAPNGSYFVRAFAAFTAFTPAAWDDFIDPWLSVDSGVLSIE